MFSWRRKAPRERQRRKHLGGSGGMLPQEIFKIEYSETSFPAFLEPRKQLPRQCWRSREWEQQNFHWLIIANLFDFQKRCLVTWVVVH